jgi:hypothetical protein
MNRKDRWLLAALICLMSAACSDHSAPAQGRDPASPTAGGGPGSAGGVQTFAPGSNATSAAAAGIIVTPTGTTQFDVACSVSASLRGPDGPVFKLMAPIRALREGREVPLLVASESDPVLEVYAGATGSSVHAVAFRAPCDAITLEFGSARCRVAAGDDFEVRECAAPVYFEPMQLSAE